MQKTIQKIHKKFDTAGEKILAEAKALIAAPMVNDTNKIERFQKLGFTSGKPIKDAEAMFGKQKEAQEMIDVIEYFQTYYPNYKFIPESAIEKICKKYNLLYGESKNYLGDIPEKNLAEIEAFKLREEDYYEEPTWGFLIDSHIQGLLLKYSQPTSFWFENTGSIVTSSGSGTTDSNIGIIPQIQANGTSVDYDTETKKKKPTFKICAPQTDFNTAGYEVKDGYKLVYDPIVIQPVKYKSIVGGLIVSKWGLEGKDESLVNEKQN